MSENVNLPTKYGLSDLERGTTNRIELDNSPAKLDSLPDVNDNSPAKLDSLPDFECELKPACEVGTEEPDLRTTMSSAGDFQYFIDEQNQVTFLGTKIETKELFLNFKDRINEECFFNFITKAYHLFPNLEKFRVHPENRYYKEIDGVLYSKNGEILLCCPVSYQTVNGEFHIPEGVKMVSKNAFAMNAGIEKLYLPDSLRLIFNSGFSAMKKLCFIDFGNGIKKIGDETASHVFSGCWQLKEINIPGNIESIGSHAFYGCRCLNQVILHEGLKHIGKYAFDETKVKNINLPSTVEAIGKGALYPSEYIIVNRLDLNPSGLIKGTIMQEANDELRKYRDSILSVQDSKIGKVFYFPKTLLSNNKLESVAQLYDLGMMNDKVEPSFITTYPISNSFVRYSIWIELYKDNPKDPLLISKMNKSSDRIINRFLYGAPFGCKNREEKKLIDFLNLGIASYSSVLEVYKYALQDNNIALSAYAMEIINKYFPDRASELFKKFEI